MATEGIEGTVETIAIQEEISKLLESGAFLREARENFEKAYINGALIEYNGNVTKAAKHLGIARQNLHVKMKKYGLSSRDYREDR